MPLGRCCDPNSASRRPPSWERDAKSVRAAGRAGLAVARLGTAFDKLPVVQRGKLFRVEIATKEVIEVDLGGSTVTAGDGLELRGRTLYVVRNSAGVIAEVRLAGDFASGELLGEMSDDSFRFPTTAALARGELLVVNSQFNRRATGNPELPFTVSSVKAP